MEHPNSDQQNRREQALQNVQQIVDNGFPAEKAVAKVADQSIFFSRQELQNAYTTRECNPGVANPSTDFSSLPTYID